MKKIEVEKQRKEFDATFVQTLVIMEVHDQHKLAKFISEDTCKFFFVCLSPTNKKCRLGLVRL
jgi:hypothetical protein